MKAKDNKEAQLRELMNGKGPLGAYISEHDARRILKRSTTWFWELRKGGFSFTKLGGENFYRISDFVELLERGFAKKR